MRRTYRSKKDTGGGLDHRDVILNMGEETTTTFNAFYIQNLKQTKRELSCVASKSCLKVRKRKYVKRLMKEVKPVCQRETLSISTNLTPDKSIRVNKVLDPFDMLLNSPSAPQELQAEMIETVIPKKESKTYVRKRKPRIKKFNYSSTDETESDKENTIDSNVTDIKAHELLIEKICNNSHRHIDESINKIVSNLSLIDNLKRKGTNGLFNTSCMTRNRLTKNYQSPILQKSPLCSTPFKEKYRGASIFKFSPIMQKEQMSPTSEENDQSNHSIILVSKSLVPKSSIEYKMSSLSRTPNVKVSIANKTVFTVSDKKDNSSIIDPENKGQNKTEVLDCKKLSDNSISYNEQSSSHMAEAEPFLGFSNNGAEDLVEKKMKSMLACLENQSIQDYVNTDENKLIANKSSSNDLLNIDTDINGLGIKNTDYDTSSSNIDSNDDELLTDKSDLNESSSNLNTEENKIDTKKGAPGDSSSSINPDKKELVTNIDADANVSEKSLSNVATDTMKLKTNSKKSSNSSLNVEIDENELESNNTSNNESKSITDTSIDSNKRNTSESTVHSQSSDSESLYDTCDSNQSSMGDDNPPKKEPIIAIERIDDDIFLKYYEKFLKSQDEVMSEQTDNEDYMSLANDSNNETIHVSESDNSDPDEIKVNAIIITDSSTTDDVISTEECYYEDESSEPEGRYVNFVTTRRRNEISNNSMFQLDQSYCSSNTESDKTVLSNKVNINKADNSVDVDDIPEDNLIKKHIDAKENFEAMKMDSIQYKIVTRKSRKSRLSNKSSNVSPHQSDDFNSEDSDCHRMSLKNTRGSGISRQSNFTAPVSPILKTKLSKSPFYKITTRRSCRIPKQNNSNDTEANNDENDAIFTNSTDVNRSVVENDTLKKYSEHSVNRDPISPLPVKNVSCMSKEKVVSSPEISSHAGAEVKPTIVLQPGKKWERSLSIYRRMTMVADHFDESILEDDCKQNKGRKYRQSVISTMEMQKCRDSLHNDSINSRRSTFVSNPGRPTIRFVKDPNFSRVSLNTSSVFDDLKGFLSEECDDTVIELSKLSIADSELEVTILDNFHETERVTTARDYVLRRCNQTEPILFDECYPETVLKNCHKIGEGVYGEVYLWRARDGRARVMKVVPIAGSVKVNGENQKDFHEIISEIVIAMELSALRAPIADIERQLDEGNDIHALDLHAIENATDIFNEVLAVRCVFGPYPSRLLDLWELYDECRGSENDSPAALPGSQRYVVLELANAGQDLESYQFAGAQQAYALFQQIAFGLAVAEEAFQFEHRDLHWGNVLIAPTEQKCATFVVRGRVFRVPRRGVAGTVIDYSLSRVSLARASAALYNDLAADEQLFDAVGDYQFEVYRLMRDKLGNEWKNFEPYTNILWLHYTVDKMITSLRYKRTNTKIHKHYIEKLKGIKDSILHYGSAVQYVLTDIDF